MILGNTRPAALTPTRTLLNVMNKVPTLDIALAPQLALKPVEGGEDETRQFGVLPKEETGDRHHFATGSGAHAGNHQ